MTFMVTWVIVAGTLFIIGSVGFSINAFDSWGDEKAAGIFALVAVFGLIWPVSITVGLVALVGYMVIFALVHFEMIDPPKWWDD